MTTSTAWKLDNYKLETEFGEDHVIHTTYEWELSTRWPTVSVWRQEKKIGFGAFGSVSLQKEEGRGQPRAVKKISRDLLPEAGFFNELIALTKLKDASAPGVTVFAHYRGII